MCCLLFVVVVVNPPAYIVSTFINSSQLLLKFLFVYYVNCMARRRAILCTRVSLSIQALFCSFFLHSARLFFSSSCTPHNGILTANAICLVFPRFVVIFDGTYSGQAFREGSELPLYSLVVVIRGLTRPLPSGIRLPRTLARWLYSFESRAMSSVLIFDNEQIGLT